MFEDVKNSISGHGAYSKAVSEDHGFVFKKKKADLPKQHSISCPDKRTQRRSSIGLRGKRMLENSDFCAPHPSLDPSLYYRHIDAQSSDPVRMRQLLLWCGQKLLSSKENVKTTQLKLLENISKSLVNISWYHRPPIVEEKKKVKHPGNISNLKQLQEFENVISRLETEKNMWTNLKEKYSSKHATEMANLLNNDLKKLMVAQEPNQETLNTTNVQESVTKNLDDVRKEVYHLESVMHQISILESKTKKSCELLFSMMLQAYSEREKDKSVDPMDMLKLLSTSH